MLTILLYPFILVLGYLDLTSVIKGDIYKYLIAIMLIIFIPSFIMSLYHASEEILNSSSKWRMIPLILLSIFYLPIFYTKYISKEEKYLGYILFIITIPLTILTINACGNKLLNYFDKAYENTFVIRRDKTYLSQDGSFTIDVDDSFRCDRKDSGEYAISCERLEDDSFIGIYKYDISYDNSDEIKEKLEFHINQTVDYIEENNYHYILNTDNKIVRIEYNNNIILITQENYDFGDSKYSLIIMKEMPMIYISYSEYQKMIDSINFLNYNGGVSS